MNKVLSNSYSNAYQTSTRLRDFFLVYFSEPAYLPLLPPAMEQYCSISQVRKLRLRESLRPHGSPMRKPVLRMEV